MARFKDRLPELVKQYDQMNEEFLRRCDDIWDDMCGEFSMRNGLTARQEELVEEASNKARKKAADG